MRAWVAVVGNAVVQALLVIGDPDVTATPVFAVRVAVSALALLVCAVLVVGRPSVRLVLWVAGILVVWAVVALLVPWAVVVPLAGAAVLPAVADGAAHPVRETVGVVRRRPLASVLLAVGSLLVVLVSWLVALLLGFFVTGFAAALLTWLCFGAAGVVVMRWVGALHHRGAEAALSGR